MEKRYALILVSFLVISFSGSASDTNPKHIKSSSRTSETLLEFKQPDKAITYLKKAISAGKSYSKDLNEQLALAYQQNYEFDNAITHYFDLLQRAKLDSKDIAYYQKGLAECLAGKQLSTEKSGLKVSNLGAPINSSNADHVPVLTDNENTLIFTSRRSTNGKKETADEDIYTVTKNGNDWTVPARLSTAINTNNHDAAIGVSADGNKLYVYNDTDKDGDIYESAKDGNGAWAKPIKLNSPVNSKFYEPSFFISEDAKYVFFSSNRPGGFGGLDLYLSVALGNGNWSEAMNLGASINTPYDEDAPFLNAANNILFFSSKGHSSIGGYDVFSSALTGAAWSPAINLGLPVNSPFDDLFYVQTRDGKMAYFSSERPGGFGESDIYVAEQINANVTAKTSEGVFTAMLPGSDASNLVGTDISSAPQKEDKKEISTAKLRLWIVDVATKDTLSAYLTLTDNTQILSERLVEGGKTYEFELKKGKTYGVLIERDGFALASEAITIPQDIPASGLEVIVEIQKLARETFFALQNISFHADTDLIKSYSLAELDLIFTYLQENPELSVAITSILNPDDKGIKSTELLEKRASAIIHYLETKGLDEGRIKLSANKIPGEKQATKTTNGVVFSLTKI